MHTRRSSCDCGLPAGVLLCAIHFASARHCSGPKCALALANLSFGFAPPIAIIIFCCARYKSALARLLSEKRIVLCGEASYSIYLLHLLVIFAFRWEAAPVTSFRVLMASPEIWFDLPYGHWPLSCGVVTGRGTRAALAANLYDCRATRCVSKMKLFGFRCRFQWKACSFALLLGNGLPFG